MSDCRENIIRELRGQLTIGEIESIFNRIERRFFPRGDRPQNLAHEADIKAFEDRIGSMTNDQRWSEVAKQAFKDALHEKQETLRRKYMQAERANWVLDYIKNNNEKGHVNGLIKLLVGDMKGTQDSLTLEARKDGILQMDLAEMTKAMDEYMEFFGYKMDEAQALNIVRELDTPGSTKDKAAQKLVDAWSNLADRSRQRKNDLGADIGFLKDWRMPQAWDPFEMRKFGLTPQERLQLLNPTASVKEKNALRTKARQNFMDEALKRVDRERYRDLDGNPLNDEDLRDLLNEVYNNISTNGLSEAPALPGEPTRGAKSLAQKLGEHRELHFRSAEDWYAFNKQAGQSDILGIMQRSIIANARDTALLETFGPNPKQAFKTALEWAKHWDKSDKGATFAQAYFDEIEGTLKQPLTEKGGLFANAMQGLRHWMVATKLGSLLLSQVNDAAVYAAIARTDGLGLGKAMEFAAKNLSPASAEDKKIAMQLGIATQSMINDVGMRYGEAVKGVDFSSRMANATVRLSGAQWWTDSMKRSYQMLIGFEMHNAVKQSLDAMPTQFNKMLKRYGITDAEWNIIRQAEPVEIMGEQMVTPMAIKALDENSPVVREAALKVAAMMAEEADIAIVSPGAREMAMTKFLHTRPGTLAGEAARSFMLFKTFSVSLTTKVLPRIWGVEDTSGFRAGLASQFALGIILAGGISYQLKQIAFGKDPRDISTPEFWLAAAAQSGGAGIWSDLLFSDFNRFGGGVTSTVFGPIGGLANDFAKLTLGNARELLMGRDTHLGAEVMQFAKNQTPLMNLWYTRAALDHLLFFNIQEAANPGYLRRMRNRAKTENAQNFWWDPQDTLPERGPDFESMIGGNR